ncbi:hypothetical protein D0Y65_043560 [Glycine soja]|uniref:RanBP2-type domain-containing protein n=1 Tax=Glycine soja TaxID=3848 RepID=A0A445GHZ8_GLYSO|nr:hypothetical protein D0Y65_043560 [Glycine soja]
MSMLKGGEMGGEGGREGDWECSSCNNRNYAFRSFCNRCKQPRLLVDSKTPADSKWLPRIGDWICTALGTKRLASEELVYDWDNKRLNIGTTNDQHQIYTSLEQVVGTGADPKPGLFPSYPSMNSTTAPILPLATWLPPQASAPALLGKGARQWRSGDWMCSNCNNHNYASRLQCNRCKTQRMAPMQPVNVV